MQLQEGMLQMATTQPSDGNFVGAHLSTWSPTATSFTQKFGYWEVRLKPSGQDGILDDFYLISQSSILSDGATPTDEIDIFEKPVGNIIYMTLREGTADGYQWRWNEVPVAADFDQTFHTIGLLWQEDSGYIQWFIDGKQVWEQPKYNNTDMSSMVMTLETDVNGAYGGPDSTTQFPAQSQVDYVRVFSNDPSIPLWTAQQ